MQYTLIPWSNYVFRTKLTCSLFILSFFSFDFFIMHPILKQMLLHGAFLYQNRHQKGKSIIYLLHAFTTDPLLWALIVLFEGPSPNGPASAPIWPSSWTSTNIWRAQQNRHPFVIDNMGPLSLTTELQQTQSPCSKKRSLSTFWLVGCLAHIIVDLSFHSHYEHRWTIWAPFVQWTNLLAEAGLENSYFYQARMMRWESRSQTVYMTKTSL